MRFLPLTWLDLRRICKIEYEVQVLANCEAFRLEEQGSRRVDVKPYKKGQFENFALVVGTNVKPSLGFGSCTVD